MHELAGHRGRDEPPPRATGRHRIDPRWRPAEGRIGARVHVDLREARIGDAHVPMPVGCDEPPDHAPPAHRNELRRAAAHPQSLHAPADLVRPLVQDRHAVVQREDARIVQGRDSRRRRRHAEREPRAPPRGLERGTRGGRARVEGRGWEDPPVARETGKREPDDMEPRGDACGAHARPSICARAFHTSTHAMFMRWHGGRVKGARRRRADQPLRRAPAVDPSRPRPAITPGSLRATLGMRCSGNDSRRPSPSSSWRAARARRHRPRLRRLPRRRSPRRRRERHTRRCR